jgi:hypothetical protein
MGNAIDHIIHRIGLMDDSLNFGQKGKCVKIDMLQIIVFEIENHPHSSPPVFYSFSFSTFLYSTAVDFTSKTKHEHHVDIKIFV